MYHCMLLSSTCPHINSRANLLIMFAFFFFLKDPAFFLNTDGELERNVNI